MTISVNSNHSLFQKLKNDPEVFAAVRDGYLSFYYKGRSLFEYRSNRFDTHQKYAVIWPSTTRVVEGADFNGCFSKDFNTDYEKIKSNAAVFEEKERSYVNCIATKFNFKHASPICVIDVECTIPGTKNCEMDLVLYNTQEKSIRFVEAKLYNNKELSSSKICGQLLQYEGVIKDNRDNILMRYRTSINAFNELYQINLPQPNEVKEKVVLLIFDYDSDQKNKISDIVNRCPDPDLLYYAVGDPQQCYIEPLFIGKRK
jgi:hypothetical protein